MYRGRVGLRPNLAAKTQMTVVTTIAPIENGNEAEEDGPMRLPEVIGGSAVASLSHRRLAGPLSVMKLAYAHCG
jgi:hypothetical protein